MKHYLRSTALFLLVLFMCVSTVFSASHKIYAEPETSTDTVLVESTAGNDESVLVDVSSVTENGITTVTRSAVDYLTENGLIVNYSSTETTKPNEDSEFTSSYTSVRPDGLYEAEGGSDVQVTYVAPEVEIGLVLEESEPTTSYGNEPKTTVTGDPKESDDDGIYDYTETEIAGQSSVTNETMSVVYYEYKSSVSDEMEYLVNKTLPTAENDLMTTPEHLERPTSAEEVPEIAEGYDYVLLESDTYSVFWPAFAFNSPDMENFADETPVYEDPDSGLQLFVRQGHASFIRNNRRLLVPKLYLKDKTVEITDPGMDQYTMSYSDGFTGFLARWTTAEHFYLSDKNGTGLSAYCADVNTLPEEYSSYRISNLEDADYYSEDAAAMIRSIAINGYWGQESGIGSLSAMKESLSASGAFSEDEISRLTDGTALAATQMAIWTYSNHMEPRTFVHTYFNDSSSFYPNHTVADEDDTALLFKLFYYLTDLEPTVIPEDEKDSSNTVINKKNFLKDIKVKITGKPEDHPNNLDADKTNDVYTLDVMFRLKVKALEDNDDDLAFQIYDPNDKLIVSGRISGELLDGEQQLTVGDDGYYTLTGVELEEGTEDLRFVLEGSQTLRNDVYFLSPQVDEEENPVSQPFVTVGTGVRSFSIQMDILFLLDVEDEMRVISRFWRNEVERTQIDVQKIWDDNDDFDGLRPDSITIHLFADGEEIDSAKLTEENDWAYTFENLPKHNEGKEIEYTVEEDEVAFYTASIDGYTITNTHVVEPVEIPVKKVWDDEDNADGFRPESITVHLLADGEEVDTARLTESNDWAYTFEDLPKYNEGKEIEYTVEEDEVEHYTSSIDGYTITNTYVPESVEIPVKKIWDDEDNADGFRPDSITVHLLADGKEIDTVKLSEDNDWTYTFEDLPKYNEGKEIEYTLEEDEVEHYTSAIDGYTITNTYVPETVDIPVVKIWKDDNNLNLHRPDAITVHLFADGQEIEVIQITKENDWTYTFKGLPKYKDGKEIEYTVTEDKVKGYSVTIEGFTIYNTELPPTGVKDSEAWWILGMALSAAFLFLARKKATE